MGAAVMSPQLLLGVAPSSAARCCRTMGAAKCCEESAAKCCEDPAATCCMDQKDVGAFGGMSGSGGVMAMCRALVEWLAKCRALLCEWSRIVTMVKSSDVLQNRQRVGKLCRGQWVRPVQCEFVQPWARVQAVGASRGFRCLDSPHSYRPMASLPFEVTLWYDQ